MTFAGLDVGTTTTKAVLCDPAGRVLGRAERPTPLGESDAGRLVAGALDALAEALAGRAPAAVGVTGMAETGVPLDADGEPCGPLLAWPDPRGAAQAAALADRLGAAALHGTTGVRPAAKAPLARWRWLAERAPAALAAMRGWAGAPELAVRALTGRLATEVTLAQRTMAFDVHRRRWDAALLAEAGLDPDRLPPVLPPGRPTGGVTAGAAARVPGLRAGTPVLLAGHDHPVGAWAAGVRAPGQVADSLGTAEAVLTLAAGPPDAASALGQGMGFGRAVDGATWYLLAGTGSCGALVEWAGDRLLGLPPGAERHAALGALLAAAGPGPTGITVEPYLTGRSAPAPDLGRRLALHGLTPEDDRAQLALAVVESTAYQARWMVETQAALTGHRPEAVTLLGGPVAQPRWPRVKAAVSPWATRVLAEPHAPALGAALRAAEAAGHPTPKPLPTERLAPGEEENAAAYQRRYAEAFLPLVTARSPDRAAEPAAEPAGDPAGDRTHDLPNDPRQQRS
ncbi:MULTISPECIES: FGGY-family carbohydrate kinase [Streptomyces]|uniref:FGGY-family carbohydrate kinase n=1 Tax=Streptomyces TaxID=1883 RepID=UPI00186B483B|nr:MULTISPECIES: FGGY family carbohydrate kinase [Streptomyces]